MNAKVLSNIAVMMVIMLMCGLFTFGVGNPALGFELPYPFFEDPLLSKPDILKKGVILPGDATPISCSQPNDFPRPLALGEAVDIALCNNPQIKATWANIKARYNAVGEARAAYLPNLSGTVNRTKDRINYTDSRYPDSDVTRTTYQGGLIWRLFDFGGRDANRRAANNLLTAALASHNAQLQKVLSDVAQTYFDAITAQAALKAAIEGEDIAQATLNSAKEREAKGVIPQSDRLRATTALAQAILEHNRAHSYYQKSLAILSRVIGVPTNTVISIQEEIVENVGKINKDLDSWMEEARKNHPSIVAARAQLAAAEYQVTVAKSAGLPTINFAANYYKNTRPGDAVTTTEAEETTVGIGLNIPLFDGFTNTYKIHGAQAQVEQKNAELIDTQDRVALELIKAYVDATVAIKNLGASANLLKAAQEALAVSKRRYDKGAADITEMLSTQATLSDARHQRIRSLAEWHSARLRLLASAGKIGRTAVTEEKSTSLVK